MNGLFLLGLSCVTMNMIHAGGGLYLSLTMDPAITEEVLKNDWESGREHTEKPAELELRDSSKKLVDHLVLEAPLAQLDPSVVYTPSHQKEYLVTVDLTAPMGSYNGPLTHLVSTEGKHLSLVTVTDPEQRTSTLSLAMTGKSAWIRVKAGNQEDFLELRCRPEGEDFVKEYRRYHADRSGWHSLQRTEPGFWESEEDFPPESEFPSFTGEGVSRGVAP
jgi:hypothetical protein